MSVVDNIDLPPTLLSRFDLIYLILDKPDLSTDKRLAEHLVSLYFRDINNRRSSFDIDVRSTLSILSLDFPLDLSLDLSFIIDKSADL